MMVIFIILRLLMHHHKSMIKLRSSARMEGLADGKHSIGGELFPSVWSVLKPCRSAEHENELLDRAPIKTLLLCKLSYNEIHKSP